jgi:hypothetical protein
MKNCRKRAILAGVILGLSFCGKKTVHYKTDFALTWLSSDKIALLTQKRLMHDNLRPHARDHSNLNGDYISVTYDDGRPVQIEAKSERRSHSTFSLDENPFTSAKIEYSDNKATLRMYYFEQEVPFRAGPYYYTTKIQFDHQSDNNTNANLFLPSGYEIAVVKIVKTEQSNYESSFWSPTGVGLTDFQGIHKVKRKLDQKANTIERAGFNTEGRPAVNADGVAMARRKYDGRGNVIEVTYFGADGEPTYRNDGHSVLRAKYDKSGNIIEGTYFDTEGVPTSIKGGYSIERGRFDDKGNCIEQSYFDTEGKPTSIRGGYSIKRWKYDARGNAIEEAFFDVIGRPINGKSGGFSIIRSKYDSTGNLTEKTIFDRKGIIVESKHHAIKRWKHDDKGNILIETFFDKEGKPTNHEEGYAAIHYSYNKLGNNTEYRNLDINGKLAKGKFRNAGIGYAHDNYRNILETWEIGEDDKVLIHDEGTYRNVAKKKFVRDYFGRVKETNYLDENGGGIGKAKVEK